MAREKKPTKPLTFREPLSLIPNTVELRHSRLAQWMWSAPPSARIMDADGIMLVHCIKYNGMVTHIVGGQCRALEQLLIDMKVILFMVLSLGHK